MAKLGILIPTIVGREEYLERLLPILERQRQPYGDEIKIFILKDEGESNGGKTTGVKRNKLVDMAIQQGYDYGAFFDDDDLPSVDYIDKQMEVVYSGADCGSLIGAIYFSGRPGMPFLHSNKYKIWSQDNNYYYRCPNHLNCIKLDHFKAVPFPDQTVGEDGRQSEAMAAAGILKTQYDINTVIYHYFTGQKNTPTEIEYYERIK
jgi:hypothetical protein